MEFLESVNIRLAYVYKGLLRIPSRWNYDRLALKCRAERLQGESGQLNFNEFISFKF